MEGSKLTSGVPLDYKIEDDDGAWEVHDMLDGKSLLNFESTRDWLVEGMLGAEDIAFLVGQPSVGKTFVAIDLAIAAVCGSKWAGAKVIRPLNVAFVAAEGFSSIVDRFKVAIHHHQPNEQQLGHLHVFKRNSLQLFNDEDGAINALFKEWNGGPLDLLIIDTWAMSTIGADENSAQATNKIVANCRRIIDHFGCAILFCHHTTKNGGIERGSSAIRGAADEMWLIESDAMRCIKAKHAEEPTPKKFRLTPFENSLIVEWEVALADSTVAILNTLSGTARGMSVAEICGATGISQPTVAARLKQLTADGRVATIAGRPQKFLFVDKCEVEL